MLIFHNIGKTLICCYNLLRYGGNFQRPLHNYLMVSYRPGKNRWPKQKVSRI